MADQNPPNNGQGNVPDEITVVDPVSLKALGRQAIDEAGYVVRPQTPKKSFEINQKILEQQGITSPEDPRFLQMHAQENKAYVDFANAQIHKEWADYYGDEGAFNLPLPGPRTNIELRKYLPANMQTEAVRATRVGNVTETWNAPERLGKVYDSMGRGYQTKTDEQIAEAKGFYKKRDGSYGSMSEYNLADMSGLPMANMDDKTGKRQILVLGQNQEWEERDADSQAYKAIQRSMYGPKEGKGGAMGTLGSTAWNTLYDMTWGALGATLEFAGGAGKGGFGAQAMNHLTNGTFAAIMQTLFDPQSLQKIGSRMQNVAGLRQSKISEQAEKAGLFSAHGMAKLTGSAVPQALAMFGVGSVAGMVGRGVAGMVGASQMGAQTVGNAFAKVASYGAGAAYAMHGMNDAAKANGINQEDRVGLMGMAALATVLSETLFSKMFGGKGLADGLLNKQTRKSVQEGAYKEIAEAGASTFAKTKAAELAAGATEEAAKTSALKAATGGMLGVIGKVFKGIGRGISSLAAKQGTMRGQVVGGMVEESVEELGEELMGSFTKYGYDTFFADKGTQPGKGQFGATLMPSLEEMAGAMIGGALGGGFASAMSGMIHGVEPTPILHEKFRSQTAMTMEQGEAEAMVREQFNKNWLVAPEDAAAVAQKEAAIQGELQQLRLAYDTKREMGLNDPAIIAKMMGGDDVLAQKGLELGLRKRREQAEVARLTEVVKTVPSQAAELAQAQAAVQTTEKQINDLMDGTIYAKSQMAMLIDVVKGSSLVNEQMSKEKEQLVKYNAGKDPKDQEKPKGYLDTWNNVLDEYEKTTDRKLGDIDNVEKLVKAKADADAIIATQKQKIVADKAKVEALQMNISTADATTPEGLNTILTSLQEMHKMELTPDQATFYDAQRVNAAKGRQGLVKADTDSKELAEKLIQQYEDHKDAGELDKAEAIKQQYGITDDEMDMGDEEAIATRIYNDKAKKAGQASLDDTPKTKRGTLGKKVLLSNPTIPGALDKEGNPVRINGIVEVSEEDYAARDVEGDIVTTLSDDGLDLLRSLSSDGDGSSMFESILRKMYGVLKEQKAGTTESEDAAAAVQKAKDNIRLLNDLAILLLAKGRGALHQQAGKLLGFNSDYIQQIAKAYADAQKVDADLRSELAVANAMKDTTPEEKAAKKAKIEEIEAKIAAQPKTELGEIFRLLNSQLLLAQQYQNIVHSLTDNFKQEQERIRNTDTLGRKYLCDLLKQHQAVDDDTEVLLAGKKVKYSDLAISTKKEEDLKFEDVLAAQQWWHFYFHTPDTTTGRVPTISPEISKEIARGFKGGSSSISATGTMATNWSDFNIKHIRGEDLKGTDNSSDQVRVRYLLSILHSTFASDPSATWSTIATAIDKKVAGVAVFPDSPSHEQMMAVESMLALDAERVGTQKEKDAKKKDPTLPDEKMPFSFAMAQFRVLYNQLDTAIEGYTGSVLPRKYNPKSLLLMGNAGAGKTSTALPLYLVCAAELKYIGASRKLVLVGHKQAMLDPVSAVVERCGLKGMVETSYATYDEFEANKQKHIDSHALVVLDEYSLLTTKKKKEAADMMAVEDNDKAIGGFLFLGDSSQAPPEWNTPNSADIAFFGFFPPLNLAWIHRSGVDAIAMMQAAVRTTLNNRKGAMPFDQFEYAMQFEYYSPDDDTRGWLGNKHYQTQEEMSADVVKRLKDKKRGYVVVLHKAQMGYWQALGVPVHCISYLPESPQGSEADEVWADFSSFPPGTDKKSMAKSLFSYLLTATSRAKKFVGVVGIPISKSVPPQRQVDNDTDIKQTGKSKAERDANAIEVKAVTTAFLAGAAAMQRGDTAAVIDPKVAKAAKDAADAEAKRKEAEEAAAKKAAGATGTSTGSTPGIGTGTPPPPKSGTPTPTADDIEKKDEHTFIDKDGSEVKVVPGVVYQSRKENGKQIGRVKEILWNKTKNETTVVFDTYSGVERTFTNDEIQDIQPNASDLVNEDTMPNTFHANYQDGKEGGRISIDTFYMNDDEKNGVPGGPVAFSVGLDEKGETRLAPPLSIIPEEDMYFGLATIARYSAKSNKVEMLQVVILYQTVWNAATGQSDRVVYGITPYSSDDIDYKGYAQALRENLVEQIKLEPSGRIPAKITDMHLQPQMPKGSLKAGGELMTTEQYIEQAARMGYVFDRYLQDTRGGYSKKFAIFKRGTQEIEVELQPTPLDDDARTAIHNELIAWFATTAKPLSDINRDASRKGNDSYIFDLLDALAALQLLNDFMMSNSDLNLGTYFTKNGSSWSRIAHSLDTGKDNKVHQSIAKDILVQLYKIAEEATKLGINRTNAAIGKNAKLVNNIRISSDKKTLLVDGNALVKNHVAIRGQMVHAQNPPKDYTLTSTAPTEVDIDTVDDEDAPPAIVLYTPADEIRAAIDIEIALIQRKAEQQFGTAFAQNMTFANLGKLRFGAQGYIDSDGKMSLEQNDGMTSEQVYYHEATHFVVEFLLPIPVRDSIYRQARREMTKQGLAVDERSVAEYIAQKGERYQLDRRNLRGVAYWWRRMFDWVKKAVSYLPFMKNDLAAVLYNMTYTNSYVDAPVVGRGLEVFDDQYLYSKRATQTGAEDKMIATIRDNTKRIIATSELSQAVGARLFQPTISGIGIGEITSLIWDETAIRQLAGVQQLFQRGNAQFTQKEVDLSKPNNLIEGYTYVQVSSGRLSEYKHQPGNAGKVFILQHISGDKKQDVTRNKIRGISMGYKLLNEHAVSVALQDIPLTSHIVDGKTVAKTMSQYLLEDGAASIPQEHLWLFNASMMFSNEGRIGMWGLALGGLDTETMLQRAEEVSINDILEANRVSKDLMSNKEADQIKVTERMSALFKLMMASMRIQGDDGKMFQANGEYMTRLILDLEAQGKDFTANDWVERLTAVLQKYQTEIDNKTDLAAKMEERKEASAEAKVALDTGNEVGFETISKIDNIQAGMMVKHVRALLDFVNGHIKQRSAFVEYETASDSMKPAILKKYGLTEKQGEMLRKSGMMSDNILSGLSSFYNSHIVQSALTLKWDFDRGSTRVIISSAAAESTILQNMKNDISNRFVGSDGIARRSSTMEHLFGLKTNGDDMPVSFTHNAASNDWTLKYKYTVKLNGMDYESSIDLASLDSTGKATISNAIDNLPNKQRKMEAIRSLLYFMGVKATPTTVKKMLENIGKGTLQNSDLMRELFSGAMTARNYALKAAIDDPRETNESKKDDWTEEMLALEEAMENASLGSQKIFAGGYGREEIARTDTADTRQEEQGEEGSQKVFHPLGVYNILHDIAKIKVFTEGGKGSRFHIGVLGQRKEKNQLSSNMFDTLGRGKDNLLRLRRKELRDATRRGEQYNTRHAVQYRDVNGVMQEQIFNPLLKDSDGVEIKNLHPFQGWSFGNGGVEMGGMTKRDDLLQQEALLRHNLEKLGQGKTDVMVDISNQSNRTTQPVMELSLIQVPIHLKSETLNGKKVYAMSNGIYYKKGNGSIELDTDNLMMLASQHYLRLYAAQRNSLNRWLGFFKQLYNEANTGQGLMVQYGGKEYGLHELMAGESLSWILRMPQPLDENGENNAGNLEKWTDAIYDLKGYVSKGLELFGQILGQNPSLLQRYGTSNLRPTQDYMTISYTNPTTGSEYNNVVFGADAGGRGRQKDSQLNKTVSFQDALTLDDMNTMVYLERIQAKEEAQREVGTADWLSDELQVANPFAVEVADKLKTPTEVIAYAASQAYRNELIAARAKEAPDSPLSNQQLDELQMLQIQEVVKSLYKADGDYDHSSMKAMVLEKFYSADVKSLVSAALFRASTEVVKGLPTRIPSFLENLHLSGGGKKAAFAPLVVDTSRGRIRRYKAIEKKEKGKSYYVKSMRDIMLDHFNAGKGTGENAQLLDTASQYEILKMLYKDGTASLGRLFKESGFKDVAGDKYDEALQARLNNPKDSLWLGHQLAHQFINDAAIALGYGDYTNYTKSHIDIGNEYDTNANTAIDPAKRAQTFSTTGQKPAIDSYAGVRKYCRTMSVRNSKELFNFFGGAEMYNEKVEVIDGAAWMIPLHYAHIGFSHGGPMGPVNSANALKMANTEVDMKDDNVDLQKSNNYVLAASLRVNSVEMQNWFKYMMNPQARPATSEILAPEFWDTIPPTSLYDKWNRLYITYIAQNPQATGTQAMQNADEQFFNWFNAERSLYEQRGEPFPYEYIASLGDKKQESTARAMPTNARVERATANGLVSLQLTDSSFLSGDSFGEIYEELTGTEEMESERAKANRSALMALVGTNMTPNQLLAFLDAKDENGVPTTTSIPLEQITHRKDNTQEVFQLNTNKVVDSTTASPMVQQLSILMSLSVSDEDQYLVDDIRAAWSGMLSQGLRDMVKMVVNERNGEQFDPNSATMEEMMSFLQNLPPDRMPDRMKALLKEETAKNADTSMLAKLIGDDRVGIQFAGVQTRATQLLAAYIRKEVLKQQMPAQRLTEAPGSSMEVFVWYDANGRTITVPISEAAWLEQTYGVDLDTAISGMEEKEHTTNGIQLMNRLVRRTIKPMTVEIDWIRLKRDLPEEHTRLLALWKRMDGRKPDLMAQGMAIRAAIDMKDVEDNSYAKTIFAESYAPNGIAKAFGIPPNIQPMHLFVWKGFDGQIQDMRSTLQMPDRIEVRAIVKSTIGGIIEELMPQIAVMEDGLEIQLNPEVEAFYAANPFYANIVKDVFDKIVAKMSSPKYIARIQDNIAQAIAAKAAKDGIADTPAYRKGLRGNKEYMQKALSPILQHELELALKEAGGGTKEQWIDKLTDMVIGVADTLEQLSTRTPSGPGSTLMYTAVAWTDSTVGSAIYGSALKNAITGADHDNDEITLARRTFNDYTLGKKTLEETTDAASLSQMRLFDAVKAMYSKPSTAVKLLQPIEMEEFKKLASGVGEKLLFGFNMPNALTTDIALRYSNMVGNAVGIFANMQKTLSLLHRSHQGSGAAYMLSYIDQAGTKIEVPWRVGGEYLPMQVLMEGLVNLATDNPKLNVLGVLGINFENATTVVALFAQPDLIHAWMNDNFNEIVMTDDEMNEVAMREYYIVKDDDSISTKNKKLIRQVAKLLLSQAAQKASAISESRKGIGNTQKGSESYYGSIFTLMSHLGNNKTTMQTELSILKGASDTSLTSLRSKLGDVIEEHVKVARADEKNDWNKILEKLANGEEIFFSKFFNKIARNRHEKIGDSIQRALNKAASEGNDVSVASLKDKLLEDRVLSDIEEHIKNLLDESEATTASLKEVYKAFFKLKRAERTEKYINRILSPAYENTLTLLARAALSGEYLRRFQEVANLNQGVPNEPHKKFKLMRSLQSLTGIPKDNFAQTMIALIQAVESNPDKKIDDIIQEQLSTPTETKDKAARQSDIQQALYNEHKHRAAQEGYEWLREGVAVGGIVFDYTSAIAGQGDSLNAILASADSRNYIKAVLVDAEMNNQLWLINNPLMKVKFEKMLEDCGQDDLSEEGYGNIMDEWDKALIAHWLEKGGMSSQQAELSALLKGKNGTSFVPGLVGSTGQTHRVDLTTVVGRDTLVLQLGSYLSGELDRLKLTCYSDNDNKDYQYLIEELQSVDIAGTKHITLANTALYDAMNIDRLSTGFKALPERIRNLFEIYQVMRYGFAYRETGGLSKIISTDLHASYTQHIDLVLRPMLDTATMLYQEGDYDGADEAMPLVLKSFWSQVLDKTNLNGILRFGVRAKDAQGNTTILPPVCAYGYVKNYKKDLWVGGLDYETREGETKKSYGIKIPVHVEVEQSGYTIFSRKGKGRNVLNLGLNKKSEDNPLSSFGLYDTQGILGTKGDSVETIWRSMDHPTKESDIPDGMTANKYYENPDFWKNRWKQVVPRENENMQAWYKRRQDELYEIYRQVLLSQDEKSKAARTIMDWVAREMKREQTTIVDDSHIGSIGLYMVRWMQATVEQMRKNGVDGSNWAQIVANMSGTKPTDKPIQGKETYYVARIGVAETSYSSLIDMSRLQIDQLATERGHVELAKAVFGFNTGIEAALKGNAVFEGQLTALKEAIIANTYLYAAQKYTELLDAIEGRLGKTDGPKFAALAQGKDLGLFFAEIYERNVSHWREVRMDTDQMDNHLNNVEGTKVIQRTASGLPYSLGDAIHFPDGSVGIVVKLENEKNVNRKGTNNVYTRAKYVLVPKNVMQNSGKEQAKSMVELLTDTSVPAYVIFRDLNGEYGSVSRGVDGIPIVVMDEAQADSGVALHEWGHLWSAALWLRNKVQDPETGEVSFDDTDTSEFWKMMVASIKGTAIAKLVKEREPNLDENSTAFEMELIAYTIQLSHYDRMNILDKRVEAAMFDQIRAALNEAIQPELATELAATTRNAFVIPGIGNMTVGGLGLELERRMTDRRNKLSSYTLSDNVWACLPLKLRTTIGAKVKGTTLNNIDSKWVHQASGTTPTRDKLLHDALRAWNRGSDISWTGPSGHVYSFFPHGNRITEQQVLQLVNDNLEVETAALESPINTFAAMTVEIEGMNTTTKENDDKLYEAAAKTFKAWYINTGEDTKDERLKELRDMLESIGYDAQYDGVYTQEELKGMGIPIAAIPKEAIVVRHDKDTANEHYSILLMTGEGLGAVGDGRKKQLAKGSYLANNLGGRLALKGGMLAMALQKAKPGARIPFVSVVQAQSMKAQRHLVPDLLQQVDIVVRQDKTLMDDLEGGLHDIVGNAALLNPEAYFGSVLENLVSYGEVVGSRMSKDAGIAYWADMVDTTKALQTGDMSMLGKLKGMANSRLNWLKRQVYDMDNEKIAKSREVQQLLELIRVLHSQGMRYTALNITQMDLLKNWIHNPTDASDPLVVWVRDSIEVGLHNVRASLQPEVQWMEVQTKILDEKYKVLSAAKDNTHKLFGPMLRTATATNSKGEKVVVNMNQLHLNASDPETARALADQNSGLTKEHLVLANQIHSRMIAELAEYLEANDRDLGKDDRKAKAEAKAKILLKDGMLPAMLQRSTAAMSQGQVKDSVALMVDNLLNMEAPSEGYHDPRETQYDFERLHSSLWQQFEEGSLYGGKQRLKLMGMVMGENGELIVVDEHIQRNLSKNLQDLYNVSMAHSKRARLLKDAAQNTQGAIDILRGLRYSGKDTEAAQNLLKVYGDRMLFGKLPESKRMTWNGQMYELDQLWNLSASVVYMSAIAWAPLVQMKNVVSNGFKLLSSSVINGSSGSGLFGVASLGKAVAALVANPALAEAVNDALQVVGRSERDLLNHFKHISSQKHFLNGAVGMAGQWYGDYYAKTIGMIAQLIEEGVWDAFSLKKGATKADPDTLFYDENKDPRWKTEEGKLIRLDVLQSRINNGQQKQGDTTLTMPYDTKEMHRLRTIVERYAGEANDPTMKSHLQAYGLGRMALTMRSYVLGVVKAWYRPSEVEDLTGGRSVNEKGEVVWTGRAMEGILQTVGHTIAGLNRLRKGGKFNGWSTLTPMQRRNWLLLAIHAATLGSLILLLKHLLDEDEDDGYGEKTFEYVVINGIKEQHTMGAPNLIWNDIYNNHSPIATLYINSVVTMWEAISLPYNAFIAPDKLTPKTGEISKRNTTALQDIEHLIYQGSKIGPYGGLYRGGRTLYTDFIVGEGNKD